MISTITASKQSSAQLGGNARSGLTGMGKAARCIALGAALPMLALAGCAKHSEDHFVVGSIQDNHKVRHPIIIDESEKTLDIPVARDSRDLTHASASAVDGFAQKFRNSAGGYVTILLPEGSPNKAAASKIGSKAAARLRSNGIASHRIRFFSYNANQHGNAAPVRLSYQAVSAKVEGCGQWNRDLTSTHENKQYHNFGCASQSNLAAIISNPSDLIAPRGMSSIDAQRRGAVIEEYRAQGQVLETRPSDEFSTN